MKQYKILHLFRWKIVDIVNMLPKIKEQGFNAIMISPLQEMRDGWEWWKLYQPLSYKLGNYVGDANDLRVLCYASETYGIEIIADVLLRNVASLNGNDLHPDVDPEIAKYVDIDTPQCDDWEDRYKSTMWRVGLPLVKYWLPEVQEMHRQLLDTYIKCGVKGLRIDMAKHIALPNEGCNYVTDTLVPYKEKGCELFGEVLNSPTWLLDSYAEYMMLFTEKHMVMTDNSKRVSYFESHDDYYEFKHTHYLTKEQMLYEWNKLVNIDKRHSLFFVRPSEDEFGLSDVWLDPRIKEINGR